IAGFDADCTRTAHLQRLHRFRSSTAARGHTLVPMRSPTFLALALLLPAGGCSEESLVNQDMPDLAVPSAPPDLSPSGPGSKPLGGSVTVSGGTVDRLFFGFTGDTRPSNMDDTAHYPTSTITQIFSRMVQADVQFALDLGDHMYIVAKAG